MTIKAIRTCVLAWAVLLMSGWFTERAEAFTLVDWLRSWNRPAPLRAPPYFAAPFRRGFAVAPNTAAPAPLPLPSASGPIPPTVTVPNQPLTAAPPAAVPPATLPGNLQATPIPQLAPAPSVCNPMTGTCAPGYASQPYCAPNGYCYPNGTCAPNGVRRVTARPVWPNYNRQVRYRTVWVRVPTTYYRPVASYNPITGRQVTMKPCSTYTWQIRRVPVNYFNPLLPQTYQAGVAGLFGGYPANTYAAAPYAPAPYAATPYNTTPDVYTRPAESGIGEVTPKPSLSPTEVPEIRRAEPNDQTRQSLQKAPNVTLGEINGPEVNKQSASRRLQVQPVPDPDAKEPTSAPPLLKPEDKTAFRAVRPASNIAPIVWPKVADNPVRRAVAKEPLAPVKLRSEEPAIIPGSSGWRTVE